MRILFITHYSTKCSKIIVVVHFDNLSILNFDSYLKPIIKNRQNDRYKIGWLYQPKNII
jgi:hypothetical protein